MIAIALIVLIMCIVAGAGYLFMRPLFSSSMTMNTRLIFSTSGGLVVLSYGVLALGLAGMLKPAVVACWIALLGLAAVAGLRLIRQDRVAKGATTDTTTNNGRVANGNRVGAVLLIILGLMAVLACFRPPGAIEWDALSYHLADPAVYVRLHAIRILPTEHHSNFPFTMEMLYTIALLVHSYALANLFHLATAVLTVIALIVIGREWFDSSVGMAAALVYASTPLVLWEATTAYIDVAGALYALLATVAVIQALRTTAEADKLRWLALGGIMCGVGLGIKYLALIPFGLLFMVLLINRVSWRALGVYLLAAMVVASPWYLKNIIWMHNPVYPFYYKLFPHSRYWSMHRAVVYQSEQNSFGVYHHLADPRKFVLGLLQAPWQILVDASLYYNHGEFNFAALIGGVYSALGMAMFLFRRRPKAVNLLLGLTAAQFILWFVLAQVGRYVLQFLPLGALIGGYFIWALKRASSRPKATVVAKACSSLASLLPPAAALYLVVCALFLPSEGVAGTVFQQRTGLLPSVISVPRLMRLAVSRSAQHKDLYDHLDVYAAQQWLNRNTAVNAGVIMYEETRGLYLHRPYLWGDGEHSAYIPYSTLGSASALTQWFLRHGYEYALINLNWSPLNTSHQQIPASAAPTVLYSWYTQVKQGEPVWRQLVGQAIKEGQWQSVYARHGVVVLKFQSTVGNQ